jgi:serine/threonine-protein kinase
MRRVRGQTLRQVLDRLAEGDAALAQRYSRRKLLTDFVSVCFAVDYAHSRGIVHRDLKPSNIMLGEFGEVYVLDWGIAKRQRAGRAAPDAEPGQVLAQPPTAASLTHAGALVGTPRYMSPEQLLGQTHLVSPRSDVYALGMILFELLTLSLVHASGDVSAIFDATVDGLTVRPSERAADVPPEFDAIFAHPTARDPTARTASARELAQAIERYLDGDRDLERRRALAEEHARRALAATERALTGEGRGEHAQAARGEAMDEVMRALALDPTRRDVTRSLARLLLEVPAKLPPDAEVEMESLTARSRRKAAASAIAAYLLLLASSPMFLAMGLRSWIAPAIGVGATALLVLYLAWYMTRPHPGAATSTVFVIALLNATMVALMSCWLGPFVVAPTAGAITTLFISTQVRSRQRLLVILLGVVAVTLPLALELGGLLPPSLRFEDGRMVLLGRSFHMPPTLTLIALVHGSVSWLALPPIALGGVRDALARAEQRLFLYAWHFRRLLGE